MDSQRICLLRNLKPLYKVLAGVAVLAAAALAAQSYFGRRQAEWEARVRLVQAQAALERQRAEEAVARADSFEFRADSLAGEAGRVRVVVQERIDSVRAVPTPDECLAFVEPRDRLIDSLVVAYDVLEDAFEEEAKANSELRYANVRALLAVDSLNAVLSDRPKPRPAWLPEVGLGCAAGISVTSARPDAACGLTMTWKVRLF